MSIQRQTVSLPYVGGMDDANGHSVRIAPSLSKAQDVVPGREGVLQTREGTRRYPLAASLPYADVVHAQGMVPHTDGDATVAVGGYVKRLSSADVVDIAPRYSEVTWTTEDIADPLVAEQQPCTQMSALRYTDSLGRRWVAVATGFNDFAGSVSLRVVIRWYCEGAEVTRTILHQSTPPASERWRRDWENAVRMDAHWTVDGYADYVLVAWCIDDGAGNLAFIRYQADDPTVSTTVSHKLDPANAITSVDVCGVNSGSDGDAWAIVCGTTAGDVRIRYVDIAVATTAGGIVYSHASGNDIVRVRCARAIDQTSDQVGVVSLESDSSTIMRAYCGAYDRDVGGAGMFLAQNVYSSGYFFTGCDIAPWSSEGGDSWVYSTATTYVASGQSTSAWVDSAVFDNSSGITILRGAGRIYSVGGGYLTAVGPGRSVMALTDPRGLGSNGQRYPFAVGYTGDFADSGHPLYGRCTLVELGDENQVGWYGANYYRAPMPCGSPYSGAVWSLGLTRYAPGFITGEVAVLRSDRVLSYIVDAPASVGGWHYTGGAVGLVDLQRGQAYECANAAGQITIPGGCPVLYPTHYAGAPAAYAHPPRAAVYASPSSVGSLPAQTRWWRCIYRRTLPDGRVVVSEPSNVVTFTTVANQGVYLDASTTGIGPSHGETEIVWYESDDGVQFSELLPRWQYLTPRNDAASVYIRIDRDTASGADFTRTPTRLYTDGDVLEAAVPPSATQCIQWQRRLWLCGGHRELWYSRELVTGEAPAWHPALVITIGLDRITGCQPLGERLVVWTELGTYLVSGDGPSDNGAGGFQQPALVASVGLALGDSHKTASGRLGAWWWGSDGVLRSIDLSGAVRDHHPWADSPATTGDIVEVHGMTASRDTGDVRVWYTRGATTQVAVWHEDAGIWTEFAKQAERPVGSGWVTPEQATGITYVECRTPGQYVSQNCAAWGDDNPTLSAIVTSVTMTGVTMSGPMGHQRLYAVEPMLRVTELHTVQVQIGTDTYSPDSGGAVTLRPDTGAYTGTPNTERFAFGAGAVGGLWACRVRGGFSRGQSADIGVLILRSRTAPGSGVEVPVTTAERPVEYVALGVEYGVKQDRGRRAATGNG